MGCKAGQFAVVSSLPQLIDFHHTYTRSNCRPCRLRRFPWLSGFVRPQQLSLYFGRYYTIQILPTLFSKTRIHTFPNPANRNPSSSLIMHTISRYAWVFNNSSLALLPKSGLPSLLHPGSQQLLINLTKSWRALHPPQREEPIRARQK